MFNKLRQLFSSNAEPTEQSPDHLPEPVSDLDFKTPRTAYYEKQLPEDILCPQCQTRLQAEHAPFMVALVNRRGETIDGFIMGDDEVGRFCPHCPTVVIDMGAVEERLEEIQEIVDDLPDNFGIAVMGLLDMEIMAEMEEQGEEIEEYPLIPFLVPKGSAGKRRKKTKRRKSKRKKRR